MIELSDLVADWFKEKEFPVKIYASGSPQEIWWVDLDLKHVDKQALFAIVNHANPPYVVSLQSDMRPVEYFNPGDPEFFSKIEIYTKEIIDAKLPRGEWSASAK